MVKDKREIERLHCTDCDCNEYENPNDVGNNCAFCGCKPTKHVRATNLEVSDVPTCTNILICLLIW